MLTKRNRSLSDVLAQTALAKRMIKHAAAMAVHSGTPTLSKEQVYRIMHSTPAQMKEDVEKITNAPVSPLSPVRSIDSIALRQSKMKQAAAAGVADGLTQSDFLVLSRLGASDSPDCTFSLVSEPGIFAPLRAPEEPPQKSPKNSPRMAARYGVGA